ncbi:MAG: class I SAM-dependent methyltransferase [Oceanipulchritudo sp.]
MGDETGPHLTYDLALLRKSEEKWKHSAGLRAVYGSIFETIHSRMVPGPALELGSGIGNLKERIPDVITSDLVKTPYVDRACSAYDVPPPDAQGKGGWGNIIAMDVLHHLCRPMDFFASAAAALRPGGRIILMEPAATPFGRLFYSLVHPEPIAPAKIRPPFVLPPDSEDGEFANMGMAVALFRQNLAASRERLSEWGLEISEIRYRDVLAYPLTGGYSGRQMASVSVLKALLWGEGNLPQWLLSLLALRMLVVLQKG